MTNIVQVIGTRPQYMKLIRFDDDYVIDTGQHYSEEMILDRDKVDTILQWKTLRNQIRKIEAIIYTKSPVLVIVYGDTFSTLAGAIAAKRAGIPLAHIEAGVRTTNLTIEEKIRTHVDMIADYLLCPTIKATRLMKTLNYKDVYFVGDLMYDRFLMQKKKLKKWDITIVTLHRRENLHKLPDVLDKISKIEGGVWFYVHPHTKKYMEENNLEVPKNVKSFESVSQYEMLKSLDTAHSVITDSGGLVKEAYWSGCSVEFIGKNPWPEIEAFGNGNAADKIREVITDAVRRRTVETVVGTE